MQRSCKRKIAIVRFIDLLPIIPLTHFQYFPRYGFGLWTYYDVNVNKKKQFVIQDFVVSFLYLRKIFDICKQDGPNGLAIFLRG